MYFHFQGKIVIANVSTVLLMTVIVLVLYHSTVPNTDTLKIVSLKIDRISLKAGLFKITKNSCNTYYSMKYQNEVKLLFVKVLVSNKKAQSCKQIYSNIKQRLRMSGGCDPKYFTSLFQAKMFKIVY